MTEKIEKKVMSTRVDDRLEERMKIYSESYGISNSDLIRKALRYYLRYAQKDENDISFIEPLILISKEDLSYLLDNLNKEKVEELSGRAYNIALKGIRKYLEQVGNKDLDPLDMPVKNILPILVKTIFPYDAQNWLNDVDYSLQKEIITITGTHSLNSAFSIFLKHFISKFLNPYGYKLANERIKDNMIYLMFEL